MKLAFIEELTEARMFKHRRDFERYNNRELAELAMIVILVCQAHHRDSYIRHYLDETIAMGDFRQIRSSSTDFANIIAVLKQFDEYGIKLVNSNISFPEMQFKQYAREIVNSNLSSSDAHRYLFAFEDFLKISSSDFKKLRRSALNWGGISDLDRREFRKIVTQYLNKTAMTMDVFQWYKNQS